MSSIRDVIKLLDSLHFCIGNADEKYFPLQDARKGVFMDSTGTASRVLIIIYAYITMYIQDQRKLQDMCRTILVTRPSDARLAYS